MRIALLYDPWLLSARGTLDLDGYRDDSRGMTGSEQCAVRLFEEFRAMGHTPLLFTKAERYVKGMDGMVLPWEERGTWDCEVALSINCPDGLRDVKAKFKCCYTLLNDFTFCKVGFEQHVDLFVSPSEPHLEQVMTNPAWRHVEVLGGAPKGSWKPDLAKWCVVPLGCDPERYKAEKAPGRVVYCSSPDRGLHHLLQEWAAIKRAVPHAHLRIFYRLREWVAAFENVAYFPPIEPLRQRALYIAEALRRMSDPKWGIEVRDSVSRATIEREMAEAEVLAYPCDTTVWSEGFSCTVLEACAARACPVITDCDALGGIYERLDPVQRATGWQGRWRDEVIEILRDEELRETYNEQAEMLAKEMTWKNTAQKLMAAIRARL